MADMLKEPVFGTGGLIDTTTYDTATNAAMSSGEAIVSAERMRQMKELVTSGEKHLFDAAYNNREDIAENIYRYKDLRFDIDWTKARWDNEATITPERELVKTERQEFYENQKDAGAF